MQATARGAITLTIDTTSKTFAWTGTATSDTFFLARTGFRSIRFGAGDFNGGTISSTGGGSLGVTVNNGGNFLVNNFDFGSGAIVVAGTQSTVVSQIGTISNNDSSFFTDPWPVSVTLTGDGVKHTYGNMAGTAIPYLESLDGVPLYFQDFQGGLGTFDFGPSAGEIVVIPEPSTALLIVTAPLFLFRRHRPTASRVRGTANF